MSQKNYDQLTKEQRDRLRNIEASAEIEGTPISARAKELMIDTMVGKVTIDQAIQNITTHHEKP